MRNTVQRSLVFGIALSLLPLAATATGPHSSGADPSGPSDRRPQNKPKMRHRLWKTVKTTFKKVRQSSPDLVGPTLLGLGAPYVLDAAARSIGIELGPFAHALSGSLAFGLTWAVQPSTWKQRAAQIRENFSQQALAFHHDGIITETAMDGLKGHPDRLTLDPRSVLLPAVPGLARLAAIGAGLHGAADLTRWLANAGLVPPAWEPGVGAFASMVLVGAAYGFARATHPTPSPIRFTVLETAVWLQGQKPESEANKPITWRELSQALKPEPFRGPRH